MPGEVLDGVLPLAEWIVGGRIDHPGSMLNGTPVMTIDVLRPNHDRTGILAGRIALFSYNYRAVAYIQLRPVIRNSQPQGEAECIAEPIDGLADVWIGKH